MDSLLSWGVRRDQSLPDPQALPDPAALADTALSGTKALSETKALPDAQALPAAELLRAEPAPAGLSLAGASGADLIRTEPAESGVDDYGPACTGPAYTGPAYTGAGVGPPETAGAAGRDLGEYGPNASASPELEGAGHSETGPGPGGQPDSDQSEPEDLDPDPTVSGRIIPIGLLSGAGQLALAGTARELPTVGGATAPSASAWLAHASEAVQDWASRRSFGPSSACGVSIALAVCAAGWFSAGTRIDILRGVGALWAGYLALKAGRFISAPPRAIRSSQPATAQQQRRRGDGSEPLAAPVALDIAAPVILEPGPERGQRLHQPSGAQEPAGAQRGHSAGLGHIGARRRPNAAAGWVAALGVCLAESVVYVGLAAGAAAKHWGGAWPCAIAVLGLVAVRNLITACSTPRGLGDHPEGTFRRVCAALLTMPVGGRILLIGVVAPLWGARAALLALLEWAIISIAYGLAGPAAEGVLANDDGSSSGQTSLLLRLRDDGALARTLGALVRGSLLPLPPAVLGLLAVSALAVLGLHDLPGVLMIAPAVVLLLAAPGSAHPHTGRFDWLIPSLLLGAQVLYLTAVGLGARVPQPVIFALVAALLMRYTDLALPGRPVMLAKPRRPGEQRGERGTVLGWEGRLLLAGVAAAMGIATFAYLALTAYLGLLILAKVVVISQTLREEDRS
jgi:hypothetical protein